MRERLGEILPARFRIAWELEQDWTSRQAFEDHENGPIFQHWPAEHLDLFVQNAGGLYVSAEFADRFAGFVRGEAIG
ncbi:hypothetical protein [Kitasatospora sp. MMS16-BH015]|uniref:hypothetical protein n=1 Tax=Kitasatospora sp. MMS16-BH015 TaxID=2018025 RepID=UPI000CF2818D|nr:hypothetical protein [Kitasatospora sp. MMS16-BH015]